MALKDEILRLRNEGFSYKKIVAELGCSLGTVAYHLGEGQRAKTNRRNNSHRKNNPLAVKLNKFKDAVKYYKPPVPTGHDDSRVAYKRKRVDFGKILNGRKKAGSRQRVTFSNEQMLKHFGDNPTCYLTGRPIDLNKSETYSYDHILPVSKGGGAELENLGLASADANYAKHDLTVEQFLSLCQEVLVHHGYLVTPPDNKKA